MALLIAFAPAAFAECWGGAGGNEGAWRAYVLSANGKGLQGREDLVSASPASGRAIVHPAQVSSSTTGDFVGWGTAKGEGVANCPDYFGSGWQVYKDGYAFNVYFCNQPFATLAAAAQDQTFKMEWGTCPFSPYTAQWVLYWNGVAKTCQANSFSSTPAVVAGGESIGTTNIQTIDVHWQSMQYKSSSLVWTNWGTGSNCADPGYQVVLTNNTDFWTKSV